jgi:hypothetical protein
MNKQAFESSLSRGIPLQEAAGFLHRLKTAGWGDPPDETGALEGAFVASKEQVIQQLTIVIAAKFQLMLAYHVYSQSMRGVAQHACAEVFLEHAEQERNAAEQYLKRAAVLGGGPVHVGEILPPPASADPVGILMIMARAEQEGIAAQRELKAAVGEENPLAFQIEQYMIEDQHHLDELWQLLPQDVQLSASADEETLDPAAAGGPAGMEAPPDLPLEEGAPEEGTPEDPALPPAEAAPELEGPPVDGPPPPADGPPPAEESAPPPKAESADKPKPKAEDKPKPKDSEAKAKEAFARGLRKLAGLPEDLEAQMSPEDKAIQAKINKMTPEQKHQGAADALGEPLRDMSKDPLPKPPRFSPLQEADMEKRIMSGSASLNEMRDYADHLHETGRLKRPPGAGGLGSAPGGFSIPRRAPGSSLTDFALGTYKPTGKHLLAGAAGGAALGGMLGAGQSSHRERYLRKQGPISRFQADHPELMGAASGAAAVPAAMALGRYGFLPGIAGSMAPGIALGVADKILKRREDAAAPKVASVLEGFQRGLFKLGFSSQMMPEPGAGTDPGAAPMPDDKNMIPPQPSMAAPGPQPPMATPPGMARYAPMNYLEAEETARNAQAANEAGFYKERASAAAQESASMGAQVQQIQAQLDQLTQQAAESQNQIMAAQQEAVQANDQMLNQATLAARMRMGMQQLRAQMMEIASQDPEQLAAAAGGPTPMDVGMQAQQAAGGPVDPTGGAAGGAAVDPATGQPVDPGAQAGTPGAAPAPDGAPPSPPGGSGQPTEGGSTSQPDESGKSESKDKGETTVSIKKAAARIIQLREKTAGSLGSELLAKVPYMAAGAAVGGITAVRGGRDSHVKSLREQVDNLKGQQDGGFAKTIELGKTQMQLAQAEEAKAHPVRAALTGGLAGAGLGAAVGAAVPAGIAGAKRLGQNIGTLRRVG